MSLADILIAAAEAAARAALEAVLNDD